MRYVIDIPPELADEINKLVKTGRYKTPQDFMLAALQNQAYLESVQAEGNSVSSAQTPVSSPRGSGDRLFETAIEYLRDADPASKTAQAKMLLPPEIGRVKTVPLTNALLRHKYISGLSNRLFPVKPVVRVLANLLAESGSEYVTLDDLQQKAAGRAETRWNE